MSYLNYQCNFINHNEHIMLSNFVVERGGPCAVMGRLTVQNQIGDPFS